MDEDPKAAAVKREALAYAQAVQTGDEEAINKAEYELLTSAEEYEDTTRNEKTQKNWDDAYARLGQEREGPPKPEEDGFCMYAGRAEVENLLLALLAKSQSTHTAFIVQYLDTTTTATLKVIPGSKEDRELVSNTPNAMGGWDIG